MKMYLLAFLFLLTNVPMEQHKIEQLEALDLKYQELDAPYTQYQGLIEEHIKPELLQQYKELALSIDKKQDKLPQVEEDPDMNDLLEEPEVNDDEVDQNEDHYTEEELNMTASTDRGFVTRGMMEDDIPKDKLIEVWESAFSSTVISSHLNNLFTDDTISIRAYIEFVKKENYTTPFIKVLQNDFLKRLGKFDNKSAITCKMVAIEFGNTVDLFSTEKKVRSHFKEYKDYYLYDPEAKRKKYRTPKEEKQIELNAQLLEAEIKSFLSLMSKYLYSPLTIRAHPTTNKFLQWINSYRIKLIKLKTKFKEVRVNKENPGNLDTLRSLFYNRNGFSYEVNDKLKGDFDKVVEVVDEILGIATKYSSIEGAENYFSIYPKDIDIDFMLIFADSTLEEYVYGIADSTDPKHPTNLDLQDSLYLDYLGKIESWRIIQAEEVGDMEQDIMKIQIDGACLDPSSSEVTCKIIPQKWKFDLLNKIKNATGGKTLPYHDVSSLAKTQLYEFETVYNNRSYFDGLKLTSKEEIKDIIFPINIKGWLWDCNTLAAKHREGTVINIKALLQAILDVVVNICEDLKADFGGDYKVNVKTFLAQIKNIRNYLAYF